MTQKGCSLEIFPHSFQRILLVFHTGKVIYIRHRTETTIILKMDQLAHIIMVKHYHRSIMELVCNLSLTLMYIDSHIRNLLQIWYLKIRSNLMLADYHKTAFELIAYAFNWLPADNRYFGWRCNQSVLLQKTEKSMHRTIQLQ